MTDDLTEPSPNPHIPEAIGRDPSPGYSGIENSYQPLESSLPTSVSHDEILRRGDNTNIGPGGAK